MKSLADELVELASRQVGVREEGGENCGPPSLLYAGGRHEPWCAHFIAYLFRECQRPLPRDVHPDRGRANPLASVAYMEKVFADRGWLLSAMDRPLPGDVVFFASRVGSDRGRGRHIGLVTSVDEKLVQTIEGNSGDCVARRIYTRRDSRIVAYGRVPEAR